MSNEETAEMRKTTKVSNADEDQKDGSYESAPTRPLPTPPQKSTVEGTGKPKDVTQHNDEASPEGTGKPKDKKKQKDKASPEGGNVKRQGERGAYVLLPMKAVLMVAAFVLVFSSIDLSMDNPCELKEALDLISLNYAPFCKYNATIEESVKVKKLGIAVISVHGIVFLVILSACMWPSEIKYPGLLIICVIVFIIATVFLPFLVIQYIDINDAKQNPEHQLDSRRLKSEMLRSLEKNFQSDNPGNGNTVSSGWNKIFIKYNCCAVNDVNGTTNDFDNTPWCTTSGSCQATASQIPRTCCKDVTQDDYQNAPDSCHAAVSPGTYKPGCFQIVKSMSLAKIEYYQVLVPTLSLSILLTLQILDVAVAFVMLVFAIAVFSMNGKKEHETKSSA
uniref:Uncharacterized protein LOC111122991 isoform X2 n=1 Tax=Crassostrea virginica TaxID=6565 RepID=A0A8B8CY88_CRAVI|nr:uncharacterized protein LOC111122991 isoform X2 [Crassostrea virginica]